MKIFQRHSRLVQDSISVLGSNAKGMSLQAYGNDEYFIKDLIFNKYNNAKDATLNLFSYSILAHLDLIEKTPFQLYGTHLIQE